MGMLHNDLEHSIWLDGFTNGSLMGSQFGVEQVYGWGWDCEALATQAHREFLELSALQQFSRSSRETALRHMSLLAGWLGQHATLWFSFKYGQSQQYFTEDRDNICCNIVLLCSIEKQSLKTFKIAPYIQQSYSSTHGYKSAFFY